MAKTTQTRALDIKRPDNEKLIRILHLVRIGVVAGIGAVIQEIAGPGRALR